GDRRRGPPGPSVPDAVTPTPPASAASSSDVGMDAAEASLRSGPSLVRCCQVFGPPPMHVRSIRIHSHWAAALTALDARLHFRAVSNLIRQEGPGAWSVERPDPCSPLGGAGRCFISWRA